MKIFIKLMILALVCSYASLFIIKKPDGTPIKSLDSLRFDFDLSTLTAPVRNLFINTNNSSPAVLNTSVESKNAGTAAGNKESTPQDIYRWQDEQGNWHYTNMPPAGVEVETMALQAPNVMTLYREEQEGGESESSIDTAIPAITAPLKEMQDTLQQAQEVRDQFQQKLNEQQQILEAL